MADQQLSTNGKLRWVQANELIVDPAYQRPVNKRKVRRIASDFDPDAFGALYVSERADGTKVILDGQQRHAAVISIGWGDQQVPAIVFEGLTIAQEALLFWRYNEVRTKPRPVELHNAALVAEEPRALAVDKILRDLGLVAKEGSDRGYIQGISAVNAVYDNAGGKVLTRALRVLISAYGIGQHGLSGSLITAVSVIMARHDIDDDRLARTLSKLDPRATIRRAQILRAELAVGGSSSRITGILAGLIVAAYNRRLPEGTKIHFDPEATGSAYWRPARDVLDD